jgi:spermidine synthase
VIAWKRLGRAQTPDGLELVLSQRGDEFRINADKFELMSSRLHGSEEELARLACAPLASTPAPRVLIGGLGLGYTLRAALDALPDSAKVVVAEIVPAVIEWNRTLLGHLAGRPLDDRRVQIEPRDVGAVLRTTVSRFDAILLDVDNSPHALTCKTNHILYQDAGIAAAKQVLRPAGVLAVWSAVPDPAFERRLRRAGLSAESVRVRARGDKGGSEHTIFLGRTQDFSGARRAGR